MRLLPIFGQLIRRPRRTKFTTKLRIFSIVGSGSEVSNVSSKRAASSSSFFVFVPPPLVSPLSLRSHRSLSSISATDLSTVSVPYVLVLHGLTRWHSLSWLIDRWPSPRPTLGIGSIPLLSLQYPQAVPSFFCSIFLISSIKCFSSIFPRRFR